MTTLDDLTVFGMHFRVGDEIKHLLVHRGNVMELALRYDGFAHDEDIDPDTATMEELEGAVFTAEVQFIIPIAGLRESGAKDVMQLIEPNLIVFSKDQSDQMISSVDRLIFGYNDDDLKEN